MGVRCASAIELLCEIKGDLIIRLDTSIKLHCSVGHKDGMFFFSPQFHGIFLAVGRYLGYLGCLPLQC